MWGSATTCYLGCSLTTGARPTVAMPLSDAGKAILRDIERGRVKREKEFRFKQYDLEHKRAHKRIEARKPERTIYTAPPEGWPELPKGVGYRVAPRTGKVYCHHRQMQPCPRCGRKYVPAGGTRCQWCLEESR